MCFAGVIPSGNLDAEASKINGKVPHEKDRAQVVAVLLSVGRYEDVPKQFEAETNKDLVEISGKPVIKYVYEQLLACERIDRILIYCSPDVKEKVFPNINGKTEIFSTTNDFYEDGMDALSRVSPENMMVVVPSDLPLVKPETITELLQTLEEDEDTDVLFPLIRREVCEKTFPQFRRTYAEFEGVEYTGGHIEIFRTAPFILREEEVDKNKDTIYSVFKLRKDPFGALKFLGILKSLEYIFGTLSIEDLEDHIYKKFSVKTRALIVDEPDLATDLSRPEDIPVFEKEIARRQSI